MTKNNASTNQFQFTGWHMIACMVSFFGVIIVVNLFMAFTATSSWTGLVVKNSYVASQKFNRELAAAKVQKAAGWQSKLLYRNGVLSVRLEGPDGSPLNLSNATLNFGRPAFEQQDRRILLKSDSNGTVTGDIELGSGEWLVKIIGDVEGVPYRRDARLLVDDTFSGEIQ